jgi:uncharacterized membrane protein
MMTALRIAALVTAGASGLMGGVLFGFSTFVMPALNRLPASEAVAAMQSINKTAPGALGLPLMVSGVGSAVVGAWVLTRGDVSGSAKALIVAGAAAGVLALGVTAAYHIPRNNQLDTVAAASTEAGPAWELYCPGWVSMNHVRTALSLVSAGLVIAGAVRLPS